MATLHLWPVAIWRPQSPNVKCVWKTQHVSFLEKTAQLTQERGSQQSTVAHTIWLAQLFSKIVFHRIIFIKYTSDPSDKFGGGCCVATVWRPTQGCTSFSAVGPGNPPLPGKFVCESIREWQAQRQLWNHYECPVPTKAKHGFGS